MRLQYYEDKRKVFTKQVEETIRSGIIEDVKAEFPAPTTQQQQMSMTTKPSGPPVRHRTVGSETRAMNSSFTMMSRHAKNFLKEYGIEKPGSTFAPDIMLRDPLDQEFVLNRRMAKKYYEQHLREKMQENKMKNFEQIEKKKKDLQDHELKREKEIFEKKLTEHKY